MTDKICKNCVFFDSGNKFGLSNLGWCQRFPPVKTYRKSVETGEDFSGEKEVAMGIFPVVREEVWCGEFRERKDD